VRSGAGGGGLPKPGTEEVGGGNVSKSKTGHGEPPHGGSL
jgi:hypothetical protein